MESEVNQAAQKFNDKLAADGDFWSSQGVISAKQAAEEFLKDVGSLPVSEQIAALNAAQRLNDKLRTQNDCIPGINIVVGTDSTGQQVLSDFKLNYRHRYTNGVRFGNNFSRSESAETVDLYDGDLKELPQSGNAKFDPHQLAKTLNDELSRDGDFWKSKGVIQAKQAVQEFVDSVRQLPLEQQYTALSSAQSMNDALRKENDCIPGINVVFGALPHTPYREFLSDLRLNYRHRYTNGVRLGHNFSRSESVESLDLYDPKP